MKALVFDESLHLAEVPVPVPAGNEVLIRVQYSGICNTDLEIMKGYMGFKGIPGHEFVGEVITPGSRLTGKMVVGEINCPCHACYLCRTGRPRHCPSRTVLGISGRNGVFAEYLVLPESNLHEIPDDLSLPSAVFTEPLAAANEIFEQVSVVPDQPLFIFGAGKLGLLVALVAKIRNIHAVTFDSDPEKVGLATRLGLHARLLTDLAPDEKAEVCVDCTGDPLGLSLALQHLYPKGCLVLKTTVAETAKIDLNQIVIHEIQVIGSRCGAFAPALEMLRTKVINPEPMISGIYPLEEWKEAFDFARKKGIMKVLIKHEDN